MTGRIVTPERAAILREKYDRFNRPTVQEQQVLDLAYTVEQQGQRIAAARGRHASLDGTWCDHDGWPWPCPTARDLGVKS